VRMSGSACSFNNAHTAINPWTNPDIIDMRLGVRLYAYPVFPGRLPFEMRKYKTSAKVYSFTLHGTTLQRPRRILVVGVYHITILILYVHAYPLITPRDSAKRIIRAVSDRKRYIRGYDLFILRKT